MAHQALIRAMESSSNWPLAKMKVAEYIYGFSQRRCVISPRQLSAKSGRPSSAACKQSSHACRLEPASCRCARELTEQHDPDVASGSVSSVCPVLPRGDVLVFTP